MSLSNSDIEKAFHSTLDSLRSEYPAPFISISNNQIYEIAVKDANGDPSSIVQYFPDMHKIRFRHIKHFHSILNYDSFSMLELNLSFEQLSRRIIQTYRQYVEAYKIIDKYSSIVSVELESIYG